MMMMMMMMMMIDLKHFTNMDCFLKMNFHHDTQHDNKKMQHSEQLHSLLMLSIVILSVFYDDHCNGKASHVNVMLDG